MATPKWKEALQKRKAEKDANDVKAFSLPDGKTTLRILPNPTDPEELFFADFGQHWVKSKSKKNAKGQSAIVGVALCVQKAYDEPCPYCDAISEALGHMDDNAHEFSDAEIKLMEEAKSRSRVLINAAIRVGGGNYEVKMVDLPKTAFNALIDLIDEWGDEIVSPTGGRDVVFTRSGSGINTTYQCVPASKSGGDIEKGWESSAINLETYVKSQLPKPAIAAKALTGIGDIADMKVSASLPAIGGSATAIADSTTTAAPAPTAKYTSDSSSVLDDDLDQLEDELDDVPFTEVEQQAPAVEEVVVDEPVPEEEKSQEQSTDDLLSELDDLEDLDLDV